MPQKYLGSCHCGAITFSYEGEKIEKGLRCNCSFCSRRGALMTTEVVAEQDLHIEARDDALGLYQFGAKTARHFFCKRCGIYPFHQPSRFPDHFRINIACLDGPDPDSLPVEIFDGKNLF